MEIKYQVLTKEGLSLLNKLKLAVFLKPFYLAGGTGLALQLGHRKSVDFDFFTIRTFNPKDLIRKLEIVGSLENIVEEPNTLHCTISSVKTSFLFEDSKLLQKVSLSQNFKIASIKDISCLKLGAIGSRGVKKDFVDLYYIIESGLSLKAIFDFMDDKYPQKDFNKQHFLKSLVYFEDAESNPEPNMLVSNYSWRKVKKFFSEQIKYFN